MILRWDLSQISSPAPSFANPMFEPVIEVLKRYAAITASLVMFLDDFLEVASSNTENNEENDSEIGEIAVGSREAELTALLECRADLQSCLSESDLWSVFNVRSDLHQRHSLLTSFVASLESPLPPNSGSDVVCRVLRIQLEGKEKRVCKKLCRLFWLNVSIRMQSFCLRF